MASRIMRQHCLPILATGCNPNGARIQAQDRSRGGCRYLSCSMRKSSNRTGDGVSSGSNTAFIERLNLDIRQCVAAVGRRVNTLCQGEAGLRDQLALFQVYHNFVLPHASLRQALAEPIPTNGGGSAKVWRPCTPAMAASLTDHVWSLKEVLFYRVPPWPQPRIG